MIASSKYIGRLVELRVQKTRLSVTDLRMLQTEVTSFLQQNDVGAVVLDMERLDFADNSLIHALRALVGTAQAAEKRFSLKNAPVALRYALTAPSFRMKWAIGLLPNETSTPAREVLSRRRLFGSR